MTVVVVTAPDEPIVSLEEAKAHLRVDHDDDDQYIETLIEVAIGHIDGPAGWLGRALAEQTLEWRGADFGCDGIRLPYPPLSDLVSIKYDDTTGAEQTLSADTYRVVDFPNSPRVALAYGKSWPSQRYQNEAVRIRFKAGWPFADGKWTGPAPIKHAVLLMVSELYENRDLASDAARPELPFAVTALLAPFRIFS